MARRAGPGASLFALGLLAAFSSGAPPRQPGGLLLRKCCPEGRILDRWLSECLPRNETDASTEVERLKVSELRLGYLWWLDEAAVEPSSSSRPVNFLEGQLPHREIHFGTALPCEKSFAMLLQSRGRRRRPRLLRNGTLLAVSPGRSAAIQAAFAPDEYCADMADIRGGRHVFLACACLRHACVRSCCPSGQVMSVAPAGRKTDATKCVPDVGVGEREPPGLLPRTAGHVPEQGKPPLTFFRPLRCDSNRTLVLVRSAGDLGGDTDVGEVKDLKIGTDDARRRDGSDVGTTDGGVISIDDEDDRFWLYDDGSVLLSNYGRGSPFGPRHACAAPLLGGGTAVQACELTTTAEAPFSPARRYSYAAGFAVGAFFLGATLVAIALVPELRAGSYRAEVAHAGCLLVGYVVLAASYLLPESHRTFCFAQAFVVQFSFLAAFFWLNVMCVDISWAFGGFRALPGSIADRDRRKFLFYSLYAWGCPTLICGVTALIEFTDGLPDSLIRPDIGVKTCWFFTKSATLLYFYGPMAVLLLMNVGLFAFTMWRIVQVHRDTEMLHRGESMRHQGNSSSAFASNRERFILYVKLFCLMGVTWITEFISWAEGSETILWYVTDFINLLRGVFIFVIFCCKPKVLRLVRRRLHDGWASLARACGCGGEGGDGVGRSRATSIWWGSLTSDPSNKSSGPTATSTCHTSVRMTEVNGSAARKDSKPAQETEER